jgi:hypothetical protein
MSRRQLYIPDDRDKEVWTAWNRMAKRLTPAALTTYEFKPSNLFVMIGEAMSAEPAKAEAVLRELLGLNDP